MPETTRIFTALEDSAYLQFYHIMHYPVPKNWCFFVDEKKKKADLPEINSSFSRENKNEQMDEYLIEIEKHNKLYQSLPFVDQIFLCNSITFNALKKDSDIDLFIITRPGRIWTAKFFAMIMTFFSGMKRTFRKKAKKFCLSFFVSYDYQNLYSISLKWVDIYLIYRLAHLVLLYQADEDLPVKIWETNKWIKWVLPYFPLKQSIWLGNKVFTGRSRFKRCAEWLLDGILWDLVEFILKIIQLFVIFLKKIWNWRKNRDVITNKKMLKFHHDVRKKVALKYAVVKKEK